MPVKMRICGICGEESAEVLECDVCQIKFCPSCGNITARMCRSCSETSSTKGLEPEIEETDGTSWGSDEEW